MRPQQPKPKPPTFKGKTASDWVVWTALVVAGLLLIAQIIQSMVMR